MERKVIVSVGEALDASLAAFRRRFGVREATRLEDRIRLGDGRLVTSARIHEIVGADSIPAPQAVWYDGNLIPTQDASSLAEALLRAGRAGGQSLVRVWEVNNQRK